MKSNIVWLPGLLNTRGIFDSVIDYVDDIANSQVIEVFGFDNIDKAGDFILSQIKFDEFILAGYSMGGYLAFSLLEKLKNKLTGLMVISSTFKQDSATQKQKRIRSLNIVNQRSNNVGGSNFIGISREYFSELVFAKNEDIYQKLQKMAIDVGKENYIKQQMLIMSRQDYKENLINFAGNTLIIMGEEDKKIESSQALEMYALIKNGRVCALKDCAHVPMLEKELEFNQNIRDWLLHV